jgi:hypothetical protein
MLQIVRRQTETSPSLAGKVLPFISRKERRLEIAFVSLAATNLFFISSAIAFYFLAHKR